MFVRPFIRDWKYRAITRTGHEITGAVQGKKEAVIEQLSRRGIHVIDLKIDYVLILRRFKPRHNLSMAVLSQFFEDVHNMHATGMGIPQILYSLKETTKDAGMMGVLSRLEQEARAGNSLTEAMARIGAFPWIVHATLAAGEQTGKLQEAFLVLSKYFRRGRDIQSKLADVLVYPLIVFVFLIAVMFFVGLKVIPQLQNLLPADAMGYGATRWVLAASTLLRAYWFVILMVIAGAAAGIVIYRQKDRQGFDSRLYQWPIAGNIIKELHMAYYFLNLSVLLKSGVPLLKAISDLNAVNSSQVSKHFFKCRDYMFGGMAFWAAVGMDAFFPMVVIFTLRRGEEMARLEEYCVHLAEYFNKRVAARMDGLIHCVGPLLLALGGLFLAVIAFAFLIPIYGSLTKIAGG